MNNKLSIPSRWMLLLFILFVVSFTFIAVYVNDAESKWLGQYAMLFLILAVIFSLRGNIDPFEIALVIMLIYGLIGGANYLERGAQVDQDNEMLFLISFLFLYFGYTLTKGGGQVRYKIKEDRLSFNRLDSIDFFILIAGIAFIVLDWWSIGVVPIVAGEDARYQSKPIFRLFFLFGSIVATYVFLFKRGVASKLFALMYFMLSILGAYRTQGFFMLGIVAFSYFDALKSINLSRWKLVCFVLLVFIGLNGIKLYRDASQYGGIENLSYIVEDEGLPSHLVWFSPIIHTLREGPQIFQKIRNNLVDYGYGHYFLDNILTVLPGKQEGYGMHYNRITHAVSDRTKTGTLIGAMYIDGGWIGVILFSFVLGAIIGVHKYIARDEGRYFIYIYAVTNFAVWIHSGIPFQPSNILVYFGLWMIFYRRYFLF